LSSGETVDYAETAIIQSTAQEFGISGSTINLKRFMESCNTRRTSTEGFADSSNQESLTPSEELSIIRDKIENYVRYYTAKNSMEFKTINGEIVKKFGKSRKAMTLEELRQVWAWLQSKYPIDLLRKCEHSSKIKEKISSHNMNYEQLQKLTPKDFKRYSGVHQETFKEMVKIVKAEKILQKKSGRPSKLSPSDQLLMTLSYLREYPTFFHLGVKWGINESNAYRIVIRTEKALIKSGLFNLPGKKILYPSKNPIETVAVDVSEHEIERPQKKKKNIIVASRNIIQ
jgi:hypothetical protein